MKQLKIAATVEQKAVIAVTSVTPCAGYADWPSNRSKPGYALGNSLDIHNAVAGLLPVITLNNYLARSTAGGCQLPLPMGQN